EMSFTGLLNRKLVRSLLKHGSFNGEQVVEKISDKTRHDIANLLTGWCIPVYRPRDFEYAEVTIGGVKTGAINPDTLESYIVPGLYFAGEMLEVYGDLGGFNFQWAWASGMLAGKGLGS
ncbi:MAG: NAD(P)/FAD-dependent oxidoreductase, partial [Candidatus Latescibacterota bacterium]